MVEFKKFGEPRPSIVTGCGTFTGGGAPSAISTGTVHTTRWKQKNLTGKLLSNLTLIWTNYSGIEVANANPVQVKAAIEAEGTVSDQAQARTPVTFSGGVTLATHEAGMLLKSDPVPVNIEADADFYIRDGVTVPGTSQVYQRGKGTKGGTSKFGIGNGEGYFLGDRVIDGAGNTSDDAITRHRPALILATHLDGTVTPSLALFGDSITAGHDDAGYGSLDGGWAVRGLEAEEIPYVNLAMSSERIQDIADPKKRYSRWNLAQYATHVLDAHMRNDVSVRTAAQIKTDILSFAYDCMARGQTYIQATCLPAPTSTDGWFTVANQTKEASEAVRVEVNQWIRDTSASGFVAQAIAQVSHIAGAGTARRFNACATVECDINGVLTNDGGYILGSNTAKEVTGTATSGSTTTLVDSGKSMTPNAYKGHGLYISGGTGAGQSRCISFHDATTFTVNNAFSPAPDNTSTYEVFESYGFQSGPHPFSKAFAVIGADFASQLATLMA